MASERIDLYWDEGVDLWRLADDERIYTARPGVAVKIPADTTTDLGSVPRPLWLVIAPHELSTTAVVLHDWLYRHGGQPDRVSPEGTTWTRKQADRELIYHAIAGGVPVWRAVVAYYAVRVWGWLGWQAVQEDHPATP